MGMKHKADWKTRIDKNAIGGENAGHTMTTPLVLSPEQLSELLAGKPIDLSVGETQVTLAPPEKKTGRRFASLADLSADVMAPTDFTVEFTPGRFVSFKIKPLESEVAKQVDDIGADVQPPKKKGPVGRGGLATEELDWEDAAFLARRKEVNALRTAFVITHGVLDFEIPGDDLAAKSKALRKNLPPRVIDALYSAVVGLTSDPVKQADFS